jgi:predicted nucleotidyltransferase
VPVSDLERIFGALEDSGARYLVVGGVAVVLHGHPRFTADLDLMLALDAPNVDAALSALEGLGFRPRAPVPLRAFADPAQRLEWERTKGMTVFSLWSADLPGTEVDLFVAVPLPFEAAWPRRLRADLGGINVNVASLGDLIEMKRRAGRPQDLEDVRELEALARDLAGRDD